MCFRVYEFGAGWELHVAVSRTVSTSCCALSQLCSEPGQSWHVCTQRTGRGVPSPCENGQFCPAFFQRVHQIPERGHWNVLCWPPGSSAGNRGTKIYLFFNALHSMFVWSISPRCVFIGSSPTFVYIWLKTPFKVSISCKGYHGKSQYLFV